MYVQVVCFCLDGDVDTGMEIRIVEDGIKGYIYCLPCMKISQSMDSIPVNMTPFQVLNIKDVRNPRPVALLL